LVAAFAAVYLFWGSTFLGIKFAVETIPPFLMAGSRFFLAGFLLYAVARIRSREHPTPRQWAHAGVVGCLLLAVGNGSVTYVEQTLPSAIAALIISTTPVWMVLIDWRHGGPKPSALTLCGLLMGMIGVGTIAASASGAATDTVGLWNIGILVVATVAWSYGSVWSRRADKPKSPFLSVGMQMMVAGLALLIVGCAWGEPRELDPSALSRRSMLAWVYLLVAGSLIGFTAYFWLLQVTTTARVATHSYVNPAVAVALGVWLGQEALSGQVALGGILVILSVLLILRASRPLPRAEASRADVLLAGAPGPRAMVDP
jgi:drug/metabolite transporter (DMT)-like permease